MGRLDNIDSVLRTSQSGFIRYNGISPWIDQFVGTVPIDGKLMLSTTVGNVTSTRIQTFKGEIHTTYQVTDGYDLFSRSPRYVQVLFIYTFLIYLEKVTCRRCCKLYAHGHTFSTLCFTKHVNRHEKHVNKENEFVLYR